MDKTNTADLTKRPNLQIFLDFLQFNCKLANPSYVSEKKIALRNFTGNERLRIFKELFKNKKNITQGEPLKLYKKNMAGLFLVNPERVSSNMIDHYDWSLEFYVWYKFYKIYKLLVKFGKPSLTRHLWSQDQGSESNEKQKNFQDKAEHYKGKIIKDLKSDLKKWLTAYKTINKTYTNKLTISPYIHIFCKHTPELLEIHGNINIFNCQGLEKLNHFTIQYYHFCSNKNSTDLSYLSQMIYKRNRIEYVRLQEYNEDEIMFSDSESENDEEDEDNQ